MELTSIETMLAMIIVLWVMFVPLPAKSRR